MPKLTEYKFLRIEREDEIHISEAVVYIFEGEITTEDEYDFKTNSVIPVTRYRRSKKLDKKDLPHFKDAKTFKQMEKDKNGNDKEYEYLVFTPDDFNEISTDDELRDFMDEELFKDSTRDPIPEQDKRISNKPIR